MRQEILERAQARTKRLMVLAYAFAFAPVAMVVGLTACSNDTPVAPTPSNQTTTVNVNVNTGPSPGASPGTPGGQTCGTVTTVRVGFFGIGCPSGTSPRNGEGVLPMGCIGFETATPKNAQGDVPASVHGPLIAWAVAVGPERVRLVEVEEAFNRNVVPQALGDVQVQATNTPPGCGPVTGTHSFAVVAARSASGELVAAGVAHEGDLLNVYREPDGQLMGTYRVGDPWPAWVEAMNGLPGPNSTPPPQLEGGK